MRISNFSHPSTSTPRGFHLQTGTENCPEERKTSGLSLSGIRECKCTTNKFLLEHSGGLRRQEDEMGKEDGVAKQKYMLNQSTNWFQRDSLALDLLPSSFQIAT